LAAGASRTKAAVAPPLPAAGPKLSAATSGSGFRFTFGRGGDGELVFQMQSTFSVSTNPNFRSTRVRIDSFSHVRAVLETEDGTLHMATKFVAAAGGCGAMQAKNPDAETVDLGKMIVKTFPPALDSNPIWSGLVMIKHPNSNGMQLNVNTADIIPARFVKEVTVKRDGELVFQMQSTFSVSTNPNFRFTFGRGADNSLDVAIKDTDGAVFTAQSAPSGS